MPTAKTYLVTVYTTFGNDRYADDSDQLGRIMGVQGYSHIKRHATASRYGWTADVVLTGYTNKREAQSAVNTALGNARWQNTNNVR